MSQSSDNVVEFPSDSSRDVLTEILRKRARDLLAGAIEEEVSDYLRERTVQTGLGRVAVKEATRPGPPCG